jgi:membrane protease YdiL (CAAX protease family)
LWLVTALGISLWVYEGRPWGDLALSVPTGWRLWSGIILVLAMAIVYARDTYRVANGMRAREKVRELFQRQEALALITPRSGPEFRLWIVASLTAGVTEELLCRGYIIWVFHNWMSWWFAAAASSVVFGFGHFYQGPRGVLQTALAGAVFAAVVGITGSLLPAMAIHALVDIGAGYCARLAFRDEGLPVTAPVPLAS